MSEILLKHKNYLELWYSPHLRAYLPHELHKWYRISLILSAYCLEGNLMFLTAVVTPPPPQILPGLAKTRVILITLTSGQ